MSVIRVYKKLVSRLFSGERRNPSMIYGTYLVLRSTSSSNSNVRTNHGDEQRPAIARRLDSQSSSYAVKDTTLLLCVVLQCWFTARKSSTASSVDKSTPYVNDLLNAFSMKPVVRTQFSVVVHHVQNEFCI